MLSLLRDESIIVAARDGADRIVAADPLLANHPALAVMATTITGPDAAQWLDRS